MTWRAKRDRGTVVIYEGNGQQTVLTLDQARFHARTLDFLAYDMGDDHGSRRTYTERARQVRAAADEVEK